MYAHYVCTCAYTHYSLYNMYMYVYCSKAEDDLVKLTLSLSIHKHHVPGDLPYKYCVYTPATIGAFTNAQWEMVYSTVDGLPKEHANRVLSVQANSSK